MNIALWSERCSPSSGLPYNNGLMLENIVKWRIRYKAEQPDTLVTFDNTAFPPWWGDARVHDSDKAILYRKDHTAYGYFKRYALQYEQYVWPYQIEEEARRRQRQAAGVEADGRESEGDEEKEGFEADDAKDEAASGATERRKSKQAKKKKVRADKDAPKQPRKRKVKSAVVELDEDDEQIDAAVVAAMQAEHDANGHVEAGGGVSRKRKRHHRAAQESKAAMETTEEEAEEEATTHADETNMVHTEPTRRGRGRKIAVKQERHEVDDGEVGRGQQQQHSTSAKRKKNKWEEGDNSVVVERRRSGRRSSVVV